MDEPVFCGDVRFMRGCQQRLGGNERRRETLFRIMGSKTSLDSGRTERKSEVERGPNADLAFYSDFPPMGIHNIFDNLSAQASATCFATDG